MKWNDVLVTFLGWNWRGAAISSSFLLSSGTLIIPVIKSILLLWFYIWKKKTKNKSQARKTNAFHAVVWNLFCVLSTHVFVHGERGWPAVYSICTFSLSTSSQVTRQAVLESWPTLRGESLSRKHCSLFQRLGKCLPVRRVYTGVSWLSRLSSCLSRSYLEDASLLALLCCAVMKALTLCQQCFLWVLTNMFFLSLCIVPSEKSNVLYELLGMGGAYQQ